MEVKNTINTQSNKDILQSTAEHNDLSQIINGGNGELTLSEENDDLLNMPIPTSDGVTQSKTNLIVNYIPANMTENNLRELFQAYGELESVKLMTDKVTNISLGYGFIKFAKESDASKAIEALNG